MRTFDFSPNNSKYAHTKVASVYDQLSTFNRTVSTLAIDGFDEQDHVMMRQYLTKTASDIEVQDMVQGFAKRAFLSGGADYFTKAKMMIMDRMGYTEDKANGLASSVVRTANQILSQYGGDENQVLARLVEEMQNQVLQQGHVSPAVIESAHESLTIPRTSKQIHEFTKQKLVQELQMNHYEAEKMSKSVVQEARDLLIQLRPYTLSQIVTVIVMLMQHYGDNTIVFGLRSDPFLIDELRNGLQGLSSAGQG